MPINYVKAEIKDFELLISLYNECFYNDYIKYGECPAYGRSKEQMIESIEKYPKLIIYYDDIPIGVISVEKKENGEYYLGCLCVLPEYQGKGIGANAMKYMLDYYSDWNIIKLHTPADNERNVAFYTKKCGFKIIDTKMDGKVELACFIKKRNDNLNQ